MNRPLLFAISGAFALVAVGCVDRQAQQQAKATQKIISDPTQVISVMPVITQPLSETLEITGQVTSGEDAAVGARQSGKLTAVFVRDGDPVVGGALIATQDTSTQQAQLRQALAGLSSASSQLSQAIANAKIGPSKSSAAVRSAQAQLASAQATLRKLRAGARKEERLQVDYQVKQAKTNMDTAQKDLDRKTMLVEQGALPRTQLDTAQNVYMQALTQYNAALQNQAMQTSGAREEDIQVAVESVRSAEEQVRQAKSQKELDVLYNDQVQSARAAVQSARAQVDVANQAIRDSQIRAPFSGRVSGKPAQPGQIVGPGTTIAHVVGSGGAYIDGNVPESEITRVAPGKAVAITLSAIQGRLFMGHVAAISPVGSDVGRQFTVRISFDSLTAGIQPGMFARGVITLRTIPNAILVPATAVVPYKDQQVVFVLNGADAVKALTVMTGLRQGDSIQIVSGLAPGEKVVVRGQEALNEKSKVRVEVAKTTASNSPIAGVVGG